MEIPSDVRLNQPMHITTRRGTHKRSRCELSFMSLHATGDPSTSSSSAFPGLLNLAIDPTVYRSSAASFTSLVNGGRQSAGRDAGNLSAKIDAAASVPGIPPVTRRNLQSRSVQRSYVSTEGGRDVSDSNH